MITAVVILCSCLGIACIIYASAHFYKTWSEVQMRNRLFDKEMKEMKGDEDAAVNELQKRLEDLRRARFAVQPTNPHSRWEMKSISHQPRKIVPMPRSGAKRNPPAGEG